MVAYAFCHRACFYKKFHTKLKIWILSGRLGNLFVVMALSFLLKCLLGVFYKYRRCQLVSYVIPRRVKICLWMPQLVSNAIPRRVKICLGMPLKGGCRLLFWFLRLIWGLQSCAEQISFCLNGLTCLYCQFICPTFALALPFMGQKLIHAWFVACTFICISSTLIVWFWDLYK